MIKLHLLGKSVTSNDPHAYSLERTQNFGKKEGETVEFSLFESMYLVETKKAKLEKNSKEVPTVEIKKKFTQIDKEFPKKYSVYKDLRKKGFIPKTALKFGADFRLYEKGKGPGRSHSKWVVYVDSEKNKTSWHDFSAKNRVAHSTNKKLLLAIVDDENSVLYYEINWKKF